MILIEKDKAVEETWAMPSYSDPLNVLTEVRDRLNALPTIEIVRCRECENWDVTWTNDWSPEYHYCPMIDGVRKGDFYCADAERRTDE